MTQLQETIHDKITKYSDACGICTDTTRECDTCGITCVLEDLNELQKLADNPDAVLPTAHWIRVKDRPPETETEVFIYAEIRRDDKVIGYVTTTAIYEDGTIHTEESIWNWDDINYWGTYDEETDDYIIPEGWWEERHYNDDDTRNLQVDDFVTHWMPLPKPPKETHND